VASGSCERSSSPVSAAFSPLLPSCPEKHKKYEDRYRHSKPDLANVPNIRLICPEKHKKI
jgi:hypothetical protein